MTDNDYRLIMEPPRQPHDLQGLLRFALEGGAIGDAEATEGISGLTEERRRWLEEALKGLSVDIVEELTKSLRILDPERVLSSEEEPEEMEEALERIIDFVDSIDTANDFHKIGGFYILGPCLNSPHSGLRWRCGELIATLTQNNPYCQIAVLSENILPILLKVVEDDGSEKTRVKALYATSCLIRECAEAQNAFVLNDGFSTLLRILQSPVEKLRIKTSFMLTSLCNDNPAYKDTLCDMGFIEQLVALLQREQDGTHEHLLSALLALVEDYQRAILECRRPEFLLKELLENRLENIKDRDDFKIQELLSPGTPVRVWSKEIVQSAI
nr:EOG090X0EEI [Leptodora kindtii]